MPKSTPPSAPPPPNAESLHQAINETIELVAPRDSWAIKARQEIARLHACLPNTFTDIRHIGSTAVPSLVAKDSIDLIAGLADWATLDIVLSTLQQCGYDYDTAANNGIDGRRWLFRHQHGHRTHHLHLVEMNSPQWHDRILFCDLLKRDAGLRERYASLKSMLARRFGTDRTAYSEPKTDFIQSTLTSERKNQREAN